MACPTVEADGTDEGVFVVAEGGAGYCNTTFDSVTCWPQTEGGSYAYVACPATDYSDHTRNASRFCNINGEWAPKADYFGCLKPEEDTRFPLE
nr:hypothetical protein BaRGS_021084 [Batillaria attramentaria]